MVTAPYLPPTEVSTPDGDVVIREKAKSKRAPGWATNWDLRIIDLNHLTDIGQGRDTVPAIHEPSFVDVAAAEHIYKDRSPILQLTLNGDVRAYPLEMLLWHEVVNDVVGGTPVSITYSPFCDAPAVYARTLAKQELTFGVSGFLHSGATVLYDRNTESLWRQLDGKCLVGDYVGARLQRCEAPLISWRQFADQYPAAKVLSQNTGFLRDYGRTPYPLLDHPSKSPPHFYDVADRRLPSLERVVTTDLGPETVAYPLSFLQTRRVFEHERAGHQLVALWTPGMASVLDQEDITSGRDIGAAAVFRRPAVKGSLLSFTPNKADPHTFIDAETRSTWNIAGVAMDGPMAGKALPRLVSHYAFWYAWAALWPEAGVVNR